MEKISEDGGKSTNSRDSEVAIMIYIRVYIYDSISSQQDFLVTADISTMSDMISWAVPWFSTLTVVKKFKTLTMLELL